MRDGLFHDACGLDNLREEHFALSEEVANSIHPVHQRAFDDFNRFAAIFERILQRFFRVLNDEIGYAMYEGVRQAFIDRVLPPLKVFAFFFGSGLEFSGHVDQAFSRIFPAVQDGVFNPFTQGFRNFVINTHHASVDDTHRHSG